MELKTLSIIVCTYNRANLLETCVRSILEQETDFPYEVVISDDGSNDRTPEVCAELKRLFPDKIKVNRLSANIGLGGNWASGLLSSQGKYVAFLDDDDRWTDNHRMQIMVEYLEKHPEVDLLYTNGIAHNESTGKEKVMSVPKPEDLDIHLLWKGIQKNILMDFIVAKRDAIVNNIDLDAYIRLQFPIQDWCTQLLLMPKIQYAYMDMPTCKYMITPESLSRSKTYEQIERKYGKEIIMYKYLAEQFPNDPVIVYNEDGFNSYVNHLLTSVAFRRGDYRKAKHYSKLSGGSSLSDKCTRTWLSFHLFRLVRFVKRSIAN